ncbi:MAG: hsp70 family protein [Planctomycetaceae bacterium]|nr:hsp70 family protein [Planctomycetaceae bacterium]
MTTPPKQERRHIETEPCETSGSRYVVGIDLGTTNSAVTYIDTSRDDAKTSFDKREIRTFSIPQFVAAGLIESRETLPSFHYEPFPDEWMPEQLTCSQSSLPFGEKKANHVVGVFARDHGGKTPGRMIASAKSWLCHAGVDRTTRLLPWLAADGVTKLSPVEVTARYLAHIRHAWDHAFPEFPLAGQDVVITLPASFDEVARELTVRAAKQAGIPKIVLLEEPLAAFYAWVDAHAGDWQTLVKPGQKILVCDIGGGTTDLTLICVRSETDGTIRFHRVAVGEHLILGGDNLDLALAHHLESRLVGQGNGQGKLSPNSWGLLVRIACTVKEKLLGDDASEKNAFEKMTVSVPGIGSKLISGSRRIEVTRDEIERLLIDGFMPLVPLSSKPLRRQSGVREFGLPFAQDHAITRYIAHFLATHAGIATEDAMQNGMMQNHPGQPGEPESAIPDLVLLNGGMFEAKKMQQRLFEQLTQWKTEERGQGAVVRGQSEESQHSALCALRSALPAPVFLENRRLDLAVARGAAYYGMVRRGFGERINAGLARTYYIGVEKNEECAQHSRLSLCLLPAGTEVDQEITLSGRSFELLVNTPIQFPIAVSSVRLTDRTGDLIPFDPEQMTMLPPIQTVIKPRSKSEHSVVVQLEGKLTEIGTLELWCVETGGRGRWRLDFDVRSVAETDRDAVATTAEREGIIDEEIREPIRRILAETFASDGTGKPAPLMRQLDAVSGMRRDDWPTSLLRRVGDELLETWFEGRRKSPEHEARWLNLIGYAYRPGFGLTLDDWRVEQLWRKVQGNIVNKTPACRLQGWVLWRRVAGGMTAGQQKTIADPLLSNVRNLHKQSATGLGKGSDMDLYSQEGAEIWRLLGSLELLPVEMKIELGDMILDLFLKKRAAPVYNAMIWTLGRLGTRELLHGPLNTVVPPQIAEKWLKKIAIGRTALQADLLTVMQLARKTGDRYRDVSEAGRDIALKVLEQPMVQSGPYKHLATLVREVSQLDDGEQNALFGEILPLGLRLNGK